MQLLRFCDIGGLIWWQVGYLIFITLILVYISLLVFVLPESPHWDYEKGNNERAKDLIRKIMINPAAVVNKKLEIKEEVKVDPNTKQGIIISMSMD